MSAAPQSESIALAGTPASASPTPDRPRSTMAASTQKRWLEQPKSRVATADLIAILRKEEAWDLLPRETRRRLYDLLPLPLIGQPPHDVDVHPLQTPYKQYIEEGVRTWQQDLIDGKEAKAWREQAMQAEKDRKEGRWDVFKTWKREDEWGGEDEDGDGDGDATGKKIVKDEAIDKEESSEGDEIDIKPGKRHLAMSKPHDAKTTSEEDDDESAVTAGTDAKAPTDSKS